MNVFAWILLALMLVEVVVSSRGVGKPRPVKTSEDAMFFTLAWLLYIGLFLGAVLL